MNSTELQLRQELTGNPVALFYKLSYKMDLKKILNLNSEPPSVRTKEHQEESALQQPHNFMGSAYKHFHPQQYKITKQISAFLRVHLSVFSGTANESLMEAIKSF